MRHWLCGMMLWAVAIPTASRAVDLSGVVHDADGNPLAGVRVDIASAAPKFGPGIFCPTCYLDCAKHAASDAEGRFEIAGLSPELKFRILFTAPGRVAFRTELIDPSLESLSVQLERVELPPEERRIRGVVRGDDGGAIEGALIYAVGAKSNERTWWGGVDVSPVTTDAAGRFELFLPEEILGVSLEVTAAGFAGMETDLTSDLIQAGDHDVELVVPRGVNVEGSLQRDGEPLAGAQLAIVQSDRSASHHFIKAVMAKTDALGRFSMRNVPADQEYAVFTPVGTGSQEWVLATKRFQVPRSGETRDLGTLEVEPGLRLAGRLSAREGAELPSKLKMSLGRDPAWDLIEVPVGDDGRFEISGLPPETYKVRIAGTDWEIDSERLRYQQLDDRAFGVRLESSLDDVVVPIRSPAPSPPAADAASRAVGAVAPPRSGDEEVANDDAIDAPTELVVTGLPVERTGEPTPSDAPRLRVGGQVVDDADRPVAGANVALRGMIGGQAFTYGIRHNYDVLATTTTNDDGWYYLDDVVVPLRMKRVYAAFSSERAGAQVVVQADGYGVAWKGVDAFESPGPLNIRMSPEVEVVGTVRDHEGAPVADATLRAYGLTQNWGDAVSYLRAPDALNLNVSQLELSATTDEEGRFRFRGLPRGYLASIGMRGEGFALRAIWIDAWTGDASSRPNSVEMHGERQPVFRSPVDVSLEPAGVLRVKVVDADGIPAPHGGVHLVDEERRFAGWEAFREEGLAVLDLRREGELLVMFSGDPLRPQIGAATTVQIEDRLEDVDLELRLPPARWLTGRVIDADAGAGVAGVNLRYRQSVPEEQGLHASSANCVSDATGEFRIPVTAGPGELRLPRELQGFVTRTDRRDPSPSLEIDIPEKDEIKPVTLSLSRGMVVRGVVSDSQGRPVAGANVFVQNAGAYSGGGAAVTNDAGEFVSSGLNPAEPVVVSATFGKESVRKLIDGDDEHDLGTTRQVDVSLQLEPSITLSGRVLQGGVPQAGVVMEVTRSSPDDPNRFSRFASATTGDDGIYSVAGFSPGDGYHFTIKAPGGATDSTWTHQSPYVQRIPSDASGVVRLPDVNLVEHRQTVAGRVVDLDGVPLEGVTVSASLANRGLIPRRDGLPPPWMTTGEDGLFVLSSLPNDAILLMAYLRRSNQGGTIRYPVRVKPERSQQEVVIVLDPALDRPAEHLDAP